MNFNRVHVVPMFLALVACGGAHTSPGAEETTATTSPAGTFATGRRVGAACAFAEQCGSGSCSAAYGSGVCGFCQDVRALGATCSNSLDVCSYTAECTAGVCRTKVRDLGETCTLQPKGGSDCDSDLYCDAGKEAATTSDPSGVCRPRIPEGKACSDASLAKYFACAGRASCSEGVCRENRSARLGESCADTGCETGLSCEPTTRRCIPTPLMQGSACGIVDGRYVDGCPSGTICGRRDGAVGAPESCLPLPHAGERCIRETCSAETFCEDLYSGREGRRCVTKRILGDVCKYKEECGTNLECRAGTCQAACR